MTRRDRSCRGPGSNQYTTRSPVTDPNPVDDLKHAALDELVTDVPYRVHGPDPTGWADHVKPFETVWPADANGVQHRLRWDHGDLMLLDHSETDAVADAFREKDSVCVCYRIAEDWQAGLLDEDVPVLDRLRAVSVVAATKAAAHQKVTGWLRSRGVDIDDGNVVVVTDPVTGPVFRAEWGDRITARAVIGVPRTWGSDQRSMTGDDRLWVGTDEDDDDWWAVDAGVNPDGNRVMCAAPDITETDRCHWMHSQEIVDGDSEDGIIVGGPNLVDTSEFGVWEIFDEGFEPQLLLPDRREADAWVRHHNLVRFLEMTRREEGTPDSVMCRWSDSVTIQVESLGLERLADDDDPWGEPVVTVDEWRHLIRQTDPALLAPSIHDWKRIPRPEWL